MDLAKAHAKARLAMKRREEELAQEELESGELNLVPYLDIATNILLFLLASLSSGILFGHIDTSLPDHAPASSVSSSDPARPLDEQLQLVVSVTQTELRLWSISSLEGSLNEPKARIPWRPAADADGDGQVGPYDYHALNDALVEIVKRRWPDPSARKDTTKQIILQADPTIPYETVIAVMDFTREQVPRDPDASDQEQLILFPKVHFSMGFQ